MWRRLLAGAVAIVAVSPVAVATAQQPPPPAAGVYGEAEFRPLEGTTISWRGRPYRGVLRITGSPGELALLEEIDVDGYLGGIREVPLAWPDEALAAQVVAARTYLAWTLQRGRSQAGTRYGFDICATDRCQVYGGAAVLLGDGGERWALAIERTADEVLLYEGEPAQALYHSTSGGRTEPVQDIFDGSPPSPYLQGAASPGEDSPFAVWEYELPARAFVDVLGAGDVDIGGELVDVVVRPREPGEGIWDVAITSSNGVTEVPIDRVRAVMNVHGPQRFPGLLPAARPGGGRYPQAVLSYRFEVSFDPPPATARPWMDRLPVADRPAAGTVRFSGRGWGHHVGMSQYGAKAMADAGNGYPAILAHYYGGLVPTPVGEELLPERVVVGLGWGLPEIDLEADGSFELVVDGRVFPVDDQMHWQAYSTDSAAVRLFSPEALVARFLERFGKLLPVL